jgi:hypothetical protein
MTIKQSATFLVLMAAVTLAGAGCLNNAPATPAAESPVAVVTTRTTDSEEGCLPGSARFATSTSDITFTFCHEIESALTGGAAVNVTEQNGVVTLATAGNPDFTHTVRAFRVEPTADISAAIAAQFMTEENRASCDVVEYEGPRESRFVIAGGDPETQLTCGDYRDGFFLSIATEPYVLFYVTVGQDTFMDSDQWMTTLRPVVE